MGFIATRVVEVAVEIPGVVDARIGLTRISTRVKPQRKRERRMEGGVNDLTEDECDHVSDRCLVYKPEQTEHKTETKVRWRREEAHPANEQRSRRRRLVRTLPHADQWLREVRQSALRRLRAQRIGVRRLRA